MRKPSSKRAPAVEAREAEVPAQKDKVKNFRFTELELDLLNKIARIKFMPNPTAALRALIMEEATRQGLYEVPR